MDNEERAQHGYRAVEVGTPDFGKNDNYPGDPVGALTDAADAIANILHYLFSACDPAVDSLDVREAFALEALDKAKMHFRAELRGEF